MERVNGRYVWPGTGWVGKCGRCGEWRECVVRVRLARVRWYGHDPGVCRVARAVANKFEGRLRQRKMRNEGRDNGYCE